MGGCTDCGKKGGCDTRKSGMFAAIDEALARLYPTRRWGERDENVALDGGISPDEGEALATAIAQRMGTLALFRAGDPEEWCDYIYVLCLGRTPAIVEIREDHRARLDADLAASAAGDSGEVGMGLDERYLRVVLSGVTRFAGIQEVAMTLSASPGPDRGGGEDAHGRGAPASEVVITESARGGVFDPILLPRMQTLVAILAEWDIRHIDFGEIIEAPAGFDAAGHAERFGSAPVIANYLFYPQSPTTVSTVVLGREASSFISSP